MNRHIVDKIYVGTYIHIYRSIKIYILIIYRSSAISYYRQDNGANLCIVQNLL